MIRARIIFTLFLVCFSIFEVHAQAQPAADQPELWQQELKGKEVGILMNHASLSQGNPLHEAMLAAGISVKVLFSPEHGIKGTAGAGERVYSSIDSATGLRIISLYGSKKELDTADLKGLDMLVVDLQDVGARFYTYASTIHYALIACAHAGVPVCILDRPNPNATLEGPLLDTAFRSFVGLYPIPLLHGLTLGELALMAKGEGWLGKGIAPNIHVIPIKNYSRKQSYSLPVKPSPNLPNALSIALYPGLCLFEGTPVSMGRGTELPFQVLLVPDEPKYAALIKAWESLPDVVPIRLTPKSIPAAPKPPLLGVACRGIQFTKAQPGLDLMPLLLAYEFWPEQKTFFLSFFDKLAGSSLLKTQIQQRFSESEIKASWIPQLQAFEKQKAPYLLYP